MHPGNTPAYDAAVDRRRLPVGIQTFRQIREEGYYYVDKTAYASRLADDAGKHYFLSRPRRFGKSLFVDTLKELYEGNEPLFHGLAVHDTWDWSKRHPVVRLSFAGGNFKRPGALVETASAQIEDLGRRTGVDCGGGSTAVRFRRLIEALHDQTGERVVVLVDEYDKPILNALEGSTPSGERGETPAANEQATTNRDDLRGLYGTLRRVAVRVRALAPPRLTLPDAGLSDLPRTLAVNPRVHSKTPGRRLPTHGNAFPTVGNALRRTPSGPPATPPSAAPCCRRSGRPSRRPSRAGSARGS